MAEVVFVNFSRGQVFAILMLGYLGEELKVKASECPAKPDQATFFTSALHGSSRQGYGTLKH